MANAVAKAPPKDFDEWILRVMGEGLLCHPRTYIHFHMCTYIDSYIDSYIYIYTYIHTYIHTMLQCVHLLFKNHIYVIHTYIHI